MAKSSIGLLLAPFGNPSFGNPFTSIDFPEWLWNVCRRRFAVAAPPLNLTTMPLGPYKLPNPAAAMNGWTPGTQALALTPTVCDPSSSQPPPPGPANNSLSDYVGMLKGSLTRAKQRLGSQPGGNYSGVSGDAKGKTAQLQGMNGDLAISPPGILDSSSLRMKQNSTNSESKWPSNALERPQVHPSTDCNGGSRSVDESTYHGPYQNCVPPVTQISDSSGGAPNLGLGNSNERMCTSAQANMGGRSKSLKRGNAEMDHIILAEPISMMSDLGVCVLKGLYIYYHVQCRTSMKAHMQYGRMHILAGQLRGS
jgi:hypothetical protein